MEPCPCSASSTYQECCEPYHVGARKPRTAEQLMRSRYSAFSKGLIDYLIDTLHPSKREGNEREKLQLSLDHTQWLNLKIIATSDGSEKDRSGIVEFRAIFKTEKLGAIQERSRFVRENGQWYYQDGESQKPVLPKRNDPCWCGSGKKTKKCHGDLKSTS